MQDHLTGSNKESSNFYTSYLQDGGEMGELTLEYDWSATSIGHPRKWSKTLLTTLGIILHSKFPMFLFWGPEHICFYNDAYRPSLGNNGKHPYALGKKGEDVWPEIWKDIKPLIDNVLSAKGAAWSEDLLLPIYRNGHIEDAYWTFSYSPVINETGKPEGVFVACVETTGKVYNANKIAESERNIRNIIFQAPVAMCILRGPLFIVEIANNRMFELWGKKESEVINKPIFEGLPEAKEQGLEQLLHKVFTTGERFVANERPVNLPRNGKIETVHLNFVYEALKEGDGSISGILAVAVDVTSQVITRQKTEVAEERARLAINSAELGVFEIDFTTGKILTDERFNEIFNFGYSPHWKEVIGIVHPDDLKVGEKAHKAAIETGILNYETRILRKDKSISWVRSKGVVIYDEKGKADKLLGVIQDITEQKQFAEALEKKVLERTKELAEANLQLQQSNIELNQFAYIASHDLQEPLRKVRTFTDLMQSSLGEIPDKAKNYINRIQSSTERMQALINDVLKFSLLSKEREKFQKVDLDTLLLSVLGDYELLIEQKGAKITAGALPVIEAISVQMNQLFTNLISNALKFSSKERQLEIAIQSKQLSQQEVQQHKELNDDKVHYSIEFKDNGIGFSQENAKQIFIIFQRLHGKTDYSGTGIGLAMCKKIATNHHGVIYANSNPDAGSSFTIILPANQN